MAAMTVDVLPAAEGCLGELPGYPWRPAYVEVSWPGAGTVRMNHVDEGPRGAPTVVLMHGQPTWSYLNRKVIAALTDAGLRVVAPDLVGYGRSDKPTDRTSYSQAAHIAAVLDFVRALDLRDATIVCQDWGGPIGLAVVAEEPDRFARIVTTNTILHTADPSLAGRTGWALHGVEGQPRVVVEEAALDYIVTTAHYPVPPSGFVSAATSSDVASDVLAAYDAPFPDESHAAGLRVMPLLIPLTRNAQGAKINRATTAFLRTWDRPFLTAFGDSDVATRGWDTVFQDSVPGARGQPHTTISGAGHFIQEDKGEELAAVVAAFI